MAFDASAGASLLSVARNVSSVSRAIVLIGASLCRATIVVEQPAEPLAAANPAEISYGNTLDQLVGQALVIPLSVVVLDVLSDHPAEMTTAEWDHPVQTLLFDGPHEAFGVRIGIGCLEGCLRHSNPGLSQSGTHRRALHFVSRSQISRCCRICSPSSVAVIVRTTWRINGSLANGVEPRICMRREARSMANTV